ncbi:MAG TPA: alpha/beta hydrolase [Anaerolineales bacterium]|jgi:alpha-beta hydrolase superfamily lysophospholipase
MKTVESQFQAADGQMLRVQGWEPDGKPKAVVVLVHGLGEHTGRFAHVGAALTKAGYVLIGFDLRGHGLTEGPRGYAPSFKVMMDDIGAFFAFVRQRYSENVPYFQYGHSLGGLLTIAYHLYGKPDVAGVMVSAPGFASPLLEQKGKIMMVRLLNSILPKMILDTGLDVKTLSRDPKVVKAYVEDPLVHEKTSLSFGKAGLDAIDFAFKHASEFTAPLLIMHGTADRLTFARGGQKFIGMVSSKDATFRPWAGLYHEIHNEPEQEQVFKVMIDWLDTHLKT